MSIKSNSSTSYRHSFLEFLLENFSVFQHLFPLTKSWILVIFVAWTIGKPQDQIWFFNIQLPYHLTPRFVLLCNLGLKEIGTKSAHDCKQSLSESCFRKGHFHKIKIFFSIRILDSAYALHCSWISQSQFKGTVHLLKLKLASKVWNVESFEAL